MNVRIIYLSKTVKSWDNTFVYSKWNYSSSSFQQGLPLDPECFQLLDNYRDNLSILLTSACKKTHHFSCI